MSAVDVVRFLDRIWGDKRSYVDLPSKVNGHWIPWNVRWPDDRDMVERRVESCLEDGEDLYFSVATFRSRGRRLVDTNPAAWLWADLDKVDPVFLSEDHVQPTIAWESSPNRYQCLWRLDRSLPPETLAKLNRALTYAIGADRSGWDLTQVLRPPGTLNHKYTPTARVDLLWDSTKTYQPQQLIKVVRAIEPEHSPGELVFAAEWDAPQMEPSSVTTRQRRISVGKVPARARRLLRTRPDMVVMGERSARLWELERLLADAGFDEDDIFKMVWDSPWNKHKEVHTGERQLRQEIRKALSRVPVTSPTVPAERKPDRGDNGSGSTAKEGQRTRADDDVGGRDKPRRPVRSAFVDYATFLGTNISTPRWLVQDIWGAASHGIIGGEPKTGKSTLALALAMAVASGRPFLNSYAVATPGPVLIIQEENAPWMMQDRLRKLAYYMGLIKDEGIEILEAPKGSMGEHMVRLDFPTPLPLKIMNNYGFDLTDEDDREMLELEVQKTRPRLIILDPFYLVSGGVNMNQQQEVMPLMQWLMALRYNYDTAVIVVHHWHKANDSSASRRPGQRLMGSGLLHGWIESALYFEAMEPDGARLTTRMEREFRGVAPRSPLELAITMGEPGELEMGVDITKYDVSGQTIAAVVSAPGISLTALAEQLGVDKRTARARAVGSGCVVVGGKRGRGHTWSVYPPGHVEGGEEEE